MVYAPRVMAIDLSTINWQAGSIGEWAAGVGTVFLAAVFIWMTRRDRRLQQRMHAQRFDIILHEPEATEAGGWVIDHWNVEVGSRQEDLRFYDVQVTLKIPAVGSSTSEPIQTLTAATRRLARERMSGRAEPFSYSTMPKTSRSWRGPRLNGTWRARRLSESVICKARTHPPRPT